MFGSSAGRTSLSVLLLAAAPAWAQCLETVDPTTRIGTIKEALSCWKTSSSALQDRLDKALATITRLESLLEASKGEVNARGTKVNEAQQNLQALRDRLDESRRETASAQRDLADAKRDADRLRNETSDAKKKAQTLREETERADLLAGGGKVKFSDTLNSSTYPFLRSISATAQFVDGKLQVSDIALIVDETHDKFPPLSEDKRYRLMFWLASWNDHANKWMSGATQRICCYVKDGKVRNLTTSAPVPLEIVTGLSIGQFRLSVALLSADSTESFTGAATGRLQEISK